MNIKKNILDIKIIKLFRDDISNQLQISIKNILLMFGLMLLISCNNHPKHGTALDPIVMELKQGSDLQNNFFAFSKIPNSIVNLLTPKINNLELADVLDGNQPEKRFNILADNAAVQSFFLDLADGTPLNVIIHPDVQGSISLSLKNVTINDVLDVVQKVYGFGFETTERSLKIFPVALQTKVFKLNYLDLARSGNSSTSVNGVNFAAAAPNMNNNTSSSASNAFPLEGSNISTINNTNLWEQLVKNIQSILGILSGSIDAKNKGKAVAINPMTGNIIVTAYPNELQEIEKFLMMAESTLNKQVMLETKVLEVILKDGFRSGINWTLINNNIQASQIGNNLNKGSTLDTTTDISDLSATGANSAIDIGTTGKSKLANTALTTFGGLLTLSMNYKKLVTFVELLAAQGNVQVLSSPRITTSNNQRALIKVGSDQFYITNVTTTTTSTAMGNVASTPSVTLYPFFSGISLDVTPQIGEEDITLHIHPAVSTVTGSPTQLPGPSDSNNIVDLATSSIRESDSIVRAKNGQLIIIGGLMQDKTVEFTTGIPYLQDLPFVGSVFRHTRQQAGKSELVILLRPTILDDYKVSSKLRDYNKRLKDLSPGFHFGGGNQWYGNEGETP